MDDTKDFGLDGAGCGPPLNTDNVELTRLRTDLAERTQERDIEMRGRRQADARIIVLSRHLAERTRELSEARHTVREGYADLRMVLDMHEGESLLESAQRVARERDEAATDQTWRALLRTIRSAGWSVACHNDYQQDGKPYTFWLFTHRSGVWVKGEGATDEDALNQAMTAAMMTKSPESAEP
jgi:hypothetical protein